ncbi:hypothetical protein BH11ARM1_BH11ARM1_09030 [soil metagenome]
MNNGCNAMQEFEKPLADRMSSEEAEKVIRLLAERRLLDEEAQSLPSVNDLASLANAEVGEVRDALAAIRQQNQVTTEPKVIPARRVGAFFLVLAFAVFLAMTFLVIAIGSRSDPPTIATPAAPMSAPSIADEPVIVNTAPEHP